MILAKLIADGHVPIGKRMGLDSFGADRLIERDNSIDVGFCTPDFCLSWIY